MVSPYLYAAAACFGVAMLWYLISGYVIRTEWTRRKDRVRTVVFFALLLAGLGLSIYAALGGR